MRKIQILHVDAFSPVPHKGNPAGVVLDAGCLNEHEMQQIAQKVGFNETVFVLDSDKADLRLRFFTPGHEMNLCGHATIGALYFLTTIGFIGSNSSVRVETNAGVLPVVVDRADGQIRIKMKQGKPRFLPFGGDVDRLAESLGLVKGDFDLSKPIVYGSTGTWTLLICVKKLSLFTKMKPHNELFPAILAEKPRSSIHPFCFETYDKSALMHARHFSSPYSGTTEDPVTGTASGVMGAYYLTYLKRDLPSVDFIVEQGQEIGRDGKVSVSAKRSGEDIDVHITGTAVFVREFDVEYD